MKAFACAAADSAWSGLPQDVGLWKLAAMGRFWLLAGLLLLAATGAAAMPATYQCSSTSGVVCASDSPPGGLAVAQVGARRCCQSPAFASSACANMV